MADREDVQKMYSYTEMSNKVQQADRSAFRRRNREPTGEVESLRGRSDIGRMGDRVAQTEKTEFTSKIERARKKRQKREHSSSAGAAAAGSRSATNVLASGGQTILDLGDLTGYQPSTDGARAAYENLLVSTRCIRFLDLFWINKELTNPFLFLIFFCLDHNRISLSSWRSVHFCVERCGPVRD